MNNINQINPNNKMMIYFFEIDKWKIILEIV